MTVLVNRAKMSTATTGTGSITLGSAVDGYQSFSAAGVSNADVVRYVIEDGSNWEIGTGTYGASGSILTRTVSESSNAGAAISLSGAATVFVGAAAEDLPSVTAGTLTKSFTSGETASISLSRALSPAPVVSVTKEVAQTGISNGDWDVSADGSNYEIEDRSYTADLLVNTSGSTITLGSGSWSSDDAGRRVVGNSGEVVIISVDGSVATYDASAGTDFLDDSTITSGNWSLFGLKFVAAGVTLSAGTFEGTSFLAGYKIDNTPALLNSFSVAGQDSTPFGIAFNTDGSKMYMLGSTSDSVYQYSLPTSFDISTASYDSVSFSVSGQDATPLGIAFNTDGTKLYMVGIVSGSVHQYSLSAAFDLSTASYDSVSLSVAGQDANPSGIAFNTDGSKMYVVGVSSGSVYEYALAAPFLLDADIPKYTGSSFNLAGQDSTPSGIAFNPDGTKLYMVGNTSDRVHQYSLPTSFDLSTASYDSVSLSVAGQDIAPSGIAFNTDGTKLYMVGNASNRVYQYSLSIAFDLSTASYDSVSFSVVGQDSAPRDIAFNNDGTKLYMIGSVNDSVHQYSLSIAFDLSTASYDSVSLSVAGQDFTPYDIAFNNDGTKLYMIGNVNDSVHQYSLSIAFELSTASYDSVSLSVAGQDPNPLNIVFNTDGSKLYMVGYSSRSVYEYNTAIGSTTVLFTVAPLSQYFATVTNSSGQIDSTNWSDLNSMTASEALSGANAYYAVSTDGSTFKVIDDTNGERSIVRDNSGTWQYNSNATYASETWANATRNSVQGAIEQAMSVAANQMDSTQLEAVTDPNHYTLGDTLDLAIVLYTTDSANNPVSDGVDINYDANALDQGAILGADYNYAFPDSTTVRLTSNAAQNLKIRVV